LDTFNSKAGKEGIQSQEHHLSKRGKARQLSHPTKKVNFMTDHEEFRLYFL